MTVHARRERAYGVRRRARVFSEVFVVTCTWPRPFTWTRRRPRSILGRSVDRAFARFLSFASVALFALVAARLVVHDHRYVFAIALIVVAFIVPSWLARRRMKRLLISGDVTRILGSWSSALH